MSSSCSAFVSPVEVARRVSGRPGDEAFLRQLCWRDFYLQLLAARPRLPYDDYRPRGDLWLEDDDAFAAWREGRTGYPIVDAAMRQLLREGWIHSRAQLLAASFLVKDIRLDWRLGAAHFADLLVDGDLASNSGNWQWVAGTGTDTRPNRVFNPLLQAMRFDLQGDYVRKHVPELAGLGPREIHEPWRLGRAPAPGSTTRRPSSTTPTRPRPSLPPGGRRVTCGRPPGGPRRRSEVTTRRRRDADRARGACRSRRSRRVGGRRAGRGPGRRTRTCGCSEPS